MTTHQGGCHCGRVRFEVDAPRDIKATRCNCSICNMCGFLHLFVSHSKFRLIAGKNELTTYTFNTGVAQHTFCRHCGIKAFYVPRSHPDGLSINVNCLDPATIGSVAETPFDGGSWEQNIAELSPISD
ncbi:MAG: GFA family protein [Gammaproteobacteria bacterium]|nr:GFA family protein [Gammaproteobacteria bacterium]